MSSALIALTCAGATYLVARKRFGAEIDTAIAAAVPLAVTALCACSCIPIAIAVHAGIIS